jgi:hypothetical protein
VYGVVLICLYCLLTHPTVISHEDLKYPHLPVANIGGGQQKKQVWVPLEFLWLDQDQVVRKVGINTSELRERRRSILEGGSSPEQVIKGLGEKFVKELVPKVSLTGDMVVNLLS